MRMLTAHALFVLLCLYILLQTANSCHSPDGFTLGYNYPSSWCKILKPPICGGGPSPVSLSKMFYRMASQNAAEDEFLTHISFSEIMGMIGRILALFGRYCCRWKFWPSLGDENSSDNCCYRNDCGSGNDYSPQKDCCS